MALFKKIEFYGRRALIRLVTALFPSRPASRTGKISSAVIVRVDERLGNVVLLNSVIHSFIKNHIAVTLVVCKKFGQIYEHNEKIERIIYFEKKKLFNPYHLVRLALELRKNAYDLLFDASNPNDLSTLTLFTILALRARVKFGFDRKNSSLILNRTAARPAEPVSMLDYYAFLFKKLNLKFYREQYLTFLVSMKNIYSSLREKRRKVVMAHPGGRGPKQWDIRKMLLFLAGLNREKYKVVLVLGPEERHLEPMLRKEGYQIFVPENVMELLSVLSAGDIYAGNDSGPMHLAASLGLAILAIFKPDASVVFYPAARFCRVIVTETPFDVSPGEVSRKFHELARSLC